MATRPYWLQFGASTVSGLAPTFLQWRTTAGGTLSPPAITEPGSFGMYLFSYDPITQIAFVCDGATNALSFNDRYITGVLDPFDQFGVTLNAIGNSSIALGISNLAMGAQNFSLIVQGFSLGVQNYSLGVLGISLSVQNSSLIVSSYSLTVQSFSQSIKGASLLGDSTSTFGTDLSDPGTVFGFLKRAQETREGNETYTKASGALTLSSRGSSQLLASKTIADSTTATTKT